MNITSNFMPSNTFSGIENMFNSPVVVPKNNKTDTYLKLENYYKATQEKQGFIGKTWDKIKNIFNIKSGSKNVEAILDNYKSNTNNTENQTEAIKIVNKYAKSQLAAHNTTRNTVACFASSLGLILAGLVTKKKVKSENIKMMVEMGVVLFSSMLSSTGISKLDAKSANREYTKEEFANDAEQGAIQGLLSYGINSIFNIAGLKNSKIINSGIKSIIKTLLKTSSITAPIMMEKSFAGNALRRINKKEREKLDKQMEQKKEIIDKYENYQYFDPTKDE